MIKKWLNIAVSCAVLGLAACGDSGSTNHTASASATDATPAGKVLRIGTNPEFAPFESLDEQQKINGFDVDIINAIAQEQGINVEFRSQPWDSLFPALANGDTDAVISGVTITDDRKQTMDFTEPYYQITQVVLAPANKTIKNLDDLKKLSKIGVVTGQTGDFAAQKLFGATSEKIARYKTVPLLVKEVANGGVDAAISDSAVIANYVKNNPDKSFQIVPLPDFEIENYGIAVRKGDEKNLALLNDGLKKIRANGKYAEIEAKYFASTPNTASTPVGASDIKIEK